MRHSAGLLVTLAIIARATNNSVLISLSTPNLDHLFLTLTLAHINVVKSSHVTAGRGTAVASVRSSVVGVSEAMAAGADDYDDVSLEKAYETVGLLITESRLPDKSQKGRRDGEHIPHSNVASGHKQCSDESQEVRMSVCKHAGPGLRLQQFFSVTYISIQFTVRVD